ncbi:MAG: ABC transporter permease [Bryobacteraceae bacterium]
MNSWERIRTIIGKELRQVLREPRLRVMIIVPPVVQLLVFGFAVNLDVDHARIAWSDADRTPESRALRDAFVSSGYFEINSSAGSEDAVRDYLDGGGGIAVVRILPGFARDLLRGSPAAVQILVDGSNSNNANLVSGYANRIAASFRQRPAPALAAPRVWFNPELKSRYYFVPGVLMNIITLITLMLTAMAIVREKEIGTMEQLMVTPIRPFELILGKTLPFVAIGLFDLFLVTAAARLVFGIPFRGSPLLLLGASLLFLMTTLGMGLFISTVSRTQQQALMSSFFFFMPAFMLSGFAFPVRNMPALAQWISYANPQRYFIEVLRGVFLKGSDASVLWMQLAAMAALGVAILGASTMRFQKTLD